MIEVIGVQRSGENLLFGYQVSRSQRLFINYHLEQVIRFEYFLKRKLMLIEVAKIMLFGF